MLSNSAFKRIAQSFLYLLFTLVVVVSGRLDLVVIEAHGDSNEEIFQIERGDSFHVIARHLKAGGLIKFELLFKIESLITGSASSFKPGYYRLSHGMTNKNIINALVRGPEDVKVTIQEGDTLVDIDRKLAAAKVLKSGELVNYNRQQDQSLEGFLFPDTYRFVRGANAEAVVKKFIDNFNSKVGNLVANNYQALVLASLVEKEASSPQDKLLVSGVLQRRLQIGMPLQVDASVVYVRCQGAFSSCDDQTRFLSKKDLKVKSPYNTYTTKNLPPTPIGNPGKEAIVAALAPQKSKYLYYISDPGTGRIVFAQTLDEHNKNRLKYLK